MRRNPARGIKHEYFRVAQGNRKRLRIYVDLSSKMATKLCMVL